MAIREPSFTLGIEEEYLLVDKDSRDLAPEPPPALLAKCEEALRRPGEPRVPALADRGRHPRLPLDAGGPRRAGAAAQHRGRHRRRVRSRPDRLFHPSLRQMGESAAHRQRALQRARRGFAAGGAAARDLRHARPCRHRGRRSADRSARPGGLLPAASAGAFDLLALLAGQSDRAQILPAFGVRRAAAHRHAASIRELQRICPHHGASGQCRTDRRRDQDLVGFAP